jgi:hypothetical protein
MSGKKIRVAAAMLLSFGAMVVGMTSATAAAATGEKATSITCEFPTYQYVFVGQDGTYRSEPGGPVRGYLYNGDLLNSGVAPYNTGWIPGNFYTSNGVYKGSGYALRDYFSYVRSWC